MSEPEENEENGGLRKRVSAFGQKVIGEIETIGGILTGDPNTQAEGEFNVEVGDIREEIEEDLEQADARQDEGADEGDSR